MADSESTAQRTLGNYEILTELGRGGMGVVYKARDLSLQRYVALKVLPRHLASNEVHVARFVREARAAAQLNHPNIAHVYDIGSGQGRYYIAMELVNGQALAERIRAHGPIPCQEALEITRQVAEALAVAHAAGVIHRDIKPANIMIDEAGRVKVMDFGLAKFQGATTGISMTGAVLGTPLYMAPEQFQGTNVDERADIYSLGVTLYEMLAGEPPFNADTPLGLMYQVVEKPIPDLATLVTVPPVAVRQVVARMTAKKPEDRYPSAQALLADLASPPGEERKRPPRNAPSQWEEFQAGCGELLDKVNLSWALPVVGVLLVAGLLWSVTQSQGTRTGAVTQGQDFTEDLGNGFTVSMVWIQSGSFEMGDAKDVGGRVNDDLRPVHTVDLDAFWIGKYEVTVGQFKRFVQETGHRTPSEIAGKGWGPTDDGMGSWQENINWKTPGFALTDEHPVPMVSWNDAMRFCEWLAKKTGRTYTLPTEAQWEYACRAGTTTTYSWGDNADDGAAYLNAADRSLREALPKIGWTAQWNDGYPFSAPVGRFRPNNWGLYDMLGNSSEWCLDWYGKQYYRDSPRKNPKGPEKSDPELRNGAWVGTKQRVMRDGGWHGGMMHNTCATRGKEYIDFGISGFRLVCLP